MNEELTQIETKEDVIRVIDLHTNVDGKYPIIINIEDNWNDIEIVMEQLKADTVWKAKKKNVGIVQFKFISNHIYMIIDIMYQITVEL